MTIARTIVTALLMVVVAALTCLALSASGAVLHPPSSHAQVVAIAAGVLLLAAGHTLRNIGAARVVAVDSPRAASAWWNRIEAALAGGLLVVAFTCPTWRRANVAVAPGLRHDDIFAANYRPGESNDPLHSDLEQTLTVWAEDVLHAPAKDERPPTVVRRGGEASLSFDRKVSVARFRVGSHLFAWPLPETGMRFATQRFEARLKERFSGAHAEPWSRQGMAVDSLIDIETPNYDSSDWKEFAIFLTGVPMWNDSYPFSIHAVPSLSLTGETNRFVRPENQRERGRPYPFAVTRNDTVGSEVQLAEYAWVQFGSRGQPHLSHGGDRDEPFDALGESTIRRVPRSVLEQYALRWRRAQYSSPQLAILPVDGHLSDAGRRPPLFPMRLDVPRGLAAWQPLAFVAVLLLARVLK